MKWIKLKVEIYPFHVHLFDPVFLHVGRLLNWQGAMVVQFYSMMALPGLGRET